MKKVLFVGVATCALIMPAMADDIAPYYDFLLPRAPLPRSTFLLWSWTGLYMGVNGGWTDSTGPGDITNVGTDTGTLGLGTLLTLNKIPHIVDLNISGFLGGAQIGYNWEVTPSWVVGIEADFDGEAGGSNTVTTAPVVAPFTPVATVFNRELNTVGTVRGRLGYIMAPDQLWYITAGLAYGRTAFGTMFACGSCAPAPQSERTTAIQNSTTLFGWALGPGIEWKFAPAWSIKAEYLYIDLGNATNQIVYTYGKNVSTLTSTTNERDNVVRIGLNYKLF
jgi:outer membrane immunogenic protein